MRQRRRSARIGHSIICAMSFMTALLLYSPSAHSYGFSAHMDHISKIAIFYPAGTKYGDLMVLEDCKYYFYYGSVFPDAQWSSSVKQVLYDLYQEVENRPEFDYLRGKIDLTPIPGYQYPFGLDTHDPVHGMEFAQYLLEQANLLDPPGPDPGGAGEGGVARLQKLAFAAGYYAHLCEDVAGHNMYIPRLIGMSDLGALSIFQNGDPEAVAGESENAIEINLDYRLGQSKANFVTDVIYNRMWMHTQQAEPPCGPVLYYGDYPELYEGTNPTLLFFHECVDNWYSLHPDYFYHSPATMEGIYGLLHIFRFYNQFYPSLVGFGSFTDELSHWIANHVNINYSYEWWTFEHICLAVGTIVANHYVHEVIIDRITPELKDKPASSSRIFFGLMLSDLAAADALAAEHANYLNADEYSDYKNSPIFNNSDFLLTTFGEFEYLGARIYKEIGPFDPAYPAIPALWYYRWPAWIENTMRYGVQTSLNHFRSESMDIAYSLGVFDCYFAFNGVPIRAGQVHLDQITSDQLSAHVEIFNLRNLDPVYVTGRVLNGDGETVKEQSITVDQNPLEYNTNERSEIDFTISRSELEPFTSNNCANLFIELYANNSTKPFFTTRWDEYDALEKVDATTKPAYAAYDTYSQWPHSLIVRPPAGVVAPNGGEYFSTGQDITITWEVSYPNPASIHSDVYINDSPGDFIIVAEEVHVDKYGFGSRTYRVPPDQAHINEHCRVFVETWDGYDVIMSDYSAAEFTLEYRAKPPDEPIIPGLPKQEPVDASLRPVSEDFLDSAAPNPFNPQTTIEFGLKNPAPVFMAIYDVSGRRVRLFYQNALLLARRYTVSWDGKNDAGLKMPSGIYFLKYQGGAISRNQKLVMLR